MNKKDCAYIAGITDSEGCFYIGMKNNELYPLLFQITNTNKILIDWLMKTCRIGVTDYVESKEINNYKEKYVWRVKSSNELKVFIEQIKEFLISKLPQAEIALIYLSNLKKNYYLTVEERDLKRELALKMKWLNQTNIDNYEAHHELQNLNYLFNYNKMKYLNNQDIAYIAGLIDGDGTINYNYNGKSFYRKCSFCNTDAFLIRYLKEITGLGQISLIKPKYVNWRYKSIWQLRKEEILIFLMKIKSSLVLKKEQASLMIKSYSVLNFNEKKNIYVDMGILNRRGL